MHYPVSRGQINFYMANMPVRLYLKIANMYDVIYIKNVYLNDIKGHYIFNHLRLRWV